jgi:hypothetical protein
MSEGHFDKEGNFIFDKKEDDAGADKWLEHTQVFDAKVRRGRLAMQMSQPEVRSTCSERSSTRANTRPRLIGNKRRRHCHPIVTPSWRRL